MDLEKYIGVYPDFPKKGISFKDIVPLCADGKAFKECIKQLKDKVIKYKPTIIVGPESRAFVFGAALANELGIGFVMARKIGKLPGELVSKKYDLEYGSSELFISKGVLHKTDRVLIVDDLLATGGTLTTIIDLINDIGATAVAAACIISLIELKGWEKLPIPYETLMYLSDSH